MNTTDATLDASVSQTRSHFRSTPPPRPTPPIRAKWWHRLPRTRTVVSVGLLAALVLLIVSLPVGEGALTGAGRTTLAVFAVAVWAWAFSPIDDTFVALAAGGVLVLARVVDSDTLFATLGDDTIWLLVSAFVIAAGITSSGLATRAAAGLVTGASTLWGLIHIVTAALVVTTFAVPSTSGRAALTLPVFVALAGVLREQGKGDDGEITETARRSLLVLALTFPTVILLSAVGSLLGAGAHLVTSRVVATATGKGFDFTDWLLLGLPLALVSSHMAAELVMRMFSTASDRRAPVSVSISSLQNVTTTRISGPLSVRETRAAIILGVVIVLWCTEPIHRIHPAIVALLGALVTTSPRFGSVTLKKTLKSVPWSLLLFMAATLALGDALTTSGAARWLAERLLGDRSGTSSFPFMLAVVVISTLAHLVIQSRSARSAVLVPIAVALAPGAGIDPAAAAFASTAAAGFCHSLPSSAKPVAMFSNVDGMETYQPHHLRRLSLVLGPLSAVLVLLFAFFIWPLLGLSL